MSKEETRALLEQSIDVLSKIFEYFKQMCGVSYTIILIFVKRSAGSLLAVALPLTAPLKYLLNICKTFAKHLQEFAKYYDIKIFAKY